MVEREGYLSGGAEGQPLDSTKRAFQIDPKERQQKRRRQRKRAKRFENFLNLPIDEMRKRYVQITKDTYPHTYDDIRNHFKNSARTIFEMLEQTDKRRKKKLKPPTS